MTRSLPEGARPYKRTPTFTADTVPAGLLREHTTKEGVWAKIVVLEGALLYRILTPEVQEELLTPDRHGVIEPCVPHEVHPMGAAAFYVEFHRIEPSPARAATVTEPARAAMIRSAHVHEAPMLSELAIRSKAHWRYTPEQMAVFRGELTLAPEQVREKRAHVAEEGGAVVGFYTLAPLGDERIELEHLFVDPHALRRGIGAQLFRHACEVASVAGARTLVIQSDPNAAGFYRALGATLEREIPSSIPGRTIPRFTFALAVEDHPRGGPTGSRTP